jgi:acetolactate synthase small subunit
MQRFYKIYIESDNEDGVLVKICNLFSARGYSIETLHATPINHDKTISSIEMTVLLNQDKIPNIKEKLLQIVPIRDVKIYVFDRVI